MSQEKPISDLSFEEALKKLEEIVHRLESGDTTLDDSIRMYSQGDALKKQCEARLKAAQAKIEQISLDQDGKPQNVRPFDAE
ncbi:MAG: exodeoxyribonuclease VII small subunit [Zymomonas mobilis subsp. pomaceae]|uniref:Exodeoxyribonuclease 7 small subunit n=1 Tax=Zymomonas mobilis subsp. pomaceae (strain ATCC 29192 / DSM 22645 / JCM 10191 / CCUG 17912 / NBRC 13757 / NCIMB 11200 / NRRL B-4491 / Barker I) TaxID=579138 RepID=F8EVA5_ZYMMT|nr:exodeoxyribonuclease VII small subunit [Zymomonas mobilis]AEI37312.1 exodeoxyribonuclease VII, small subunit [Zymomonas mobilis subsp. pomaceae ATCC 29192]MDX5948680.1 exodeoxyribonuclease VII small subunit [Zymomonas mobilis subsp. pomaceae]GEB88485.1 exodeoxyribonuclease 7 small subunit [Zymomonas mobilis subsp. pomaceae]